MPFDLRSLFRANPPGMPQPMRPVMGTQIGRMFGGASGPPGLAGLGRALPVAAAPPAVAPKPVAPAVSLAAGGPPALTGIANALSKMPSQAKAYGIRGRAP